MIRRALRPVLALLLAALGGLLAVASVCAATADTALRTAGPLRAGVEHVLTDGQVQAAVPDAVDDLSEEHLPAGVREAFGGALPRMLREEAAAAVRDEQTRAAAVDAADRGRRMLVEGLESDARQQPDDGTGPGEGPGSPGAAHGEGRQAPEPDAPVVTVQDGGLRIAWARPAADAAREGLDEVEAGLERLIDDGLGGLGIPGLGGDGSAEGARSAGLDGLLRQARDGVDALGEDERLVVTARMGDGSGPGPAPGLVLAALAHWRWGAAAALVLAAAAVLVARGRWRGWALAAAGSVALLTTGLLAWGYASRPVQLDPHDQAPAEVRELVAAVEGALRQAIDAQVGPVLTGTALAAGAVAVVGLAAAWAWPGRRRGVDAGR